MKKIYYGHNNASIFAAIVLSLTLVACHFDSDKDYKKDEDKAATDSTHRKDHGQEQHEPSVPPVDAARHGDSTNNRTPVTGNDSSIKKDSSK
jgi:hypothetical protein